LARALALAMALALARWMQRAYDRLRVVGSQ